MTGAELHLFTARWLLSCAKTKRRAGLPDGAATAVMTTTFALVAAVPPSRQLRTRVSTANRRTPWQPRKRNPSPRRRWHRQKQ